MKNIVRGKKKHMTESLYFFHCIFVNCIEEIDSQSFHLGRAQCNAIFMTNTGACIYGLETIYEGAQTGEKSMESHITTDSKIFTK